MRRDCRRQLVLGGLLAAAMGLCGFWKFHRPAPLPIPYCTADAIAVLDMENGRFLYEKESETPICPASLTKLMTILVVLDHMEEGTLDWEICCVVTEEDAEAPGSVWDLRPGET